MTLTFSLPGGLVLAAYFSPLRLLLASARVRAYVRACVVSAPHTQVNTQAATFQSKGMVHLEGGWPKDIVFDEVEHTIRFRKKVEKDEDYIRQVKNLGDAVEQSIMQNYAIDIYQVPPPPRELAPVRRRWS